MTGHSLRGDDDEVHVVKADLFYLAQKMNIPKYQRAAWRGCLRLLLFQIAIAAVLFLTGLLFFSVPVAVSLLLGGSVSIIAQSVFAALFFRHSGGRAIRRIVHSFYIAEAIKLVLTAVLFLIVIVFLHVKMPPFFMGYLITYLSFWLSPVCFRDKKRQ
ncbi:MAG: ATP synthase subunit I [Pseudomonadota bacterium]|nr:ATP synthase subunit I [Gammaproteobacteria bacterium]MBU1559125.1 ATP synthase subunit I [Gammaproteobacteria bacterium]MBU1927221.1 ATP synthase subunit I [Gammaproteobacteria bacterium]MBU2546486.1 ATP synthase subunit I [Gammaproteobacteria bacterium]